MFDLFGDTFRSMEVKGKGTLEASVYRVDPVTAS